MTDRTAKLGGGPPSIAFLVDWLEDTYQYTVMRGAYDAARARGAQLLCFAGGVLDRPGRGGADRNHLYDLVRADNVSGVVVMSGAIGNYAGLARLTALCDALKPLPVCSIAVELPGVSSVVVDDAVGMRKAVTHLIRVHGCRRIGFVRGPSANAEAERRYDVYRSVLGEHELSFDDKLVASGDFQPQSGEQAVDTWFDERRLSPSDLDAIVTANDSMALGVLRALDRRSIRVPDQIALVGFDDVEDIRYTVPPLTSVRQPLYEQGKEAVRIVLARLQGRDEPSPVVLHTDLVTRRSCRCFEHSSRSSAAQAAPSGRSSFEAVLVERRQIVLAELSRAARGALAAAGAGWELKLFNAFAAQLRGESTAGFVESFDDILHRVQQGRGDITVCHDVLSALRRQMIACLGAEPERRAYAEDLFQEVRLLTGNMIARDQARERLRIGQWARTLSETGAALVSTFNFARLGDVVADSFPALGIQNCALVLYADDPAQARLVFAYQAGHLLDVPEARRWFRASEIVPPLLDKRSFAVLPLSSAEQRLGYLLVELGLREGFVYESLREVFSAAVRGSLLAREVATLRPNR